MMERTASVNKDMLKLIMSVNHVKVDQLQIQLKLHVFVKTHYNSMIILEDHALTALHSLLQILMIPTVSVNQVIKNRMVNVSQLALLNLLQMMLDSVYVQMAKS